MRRHLLAGWLLVLTVGCSSLPLGPLKVDPNRPDTLVPPTPLRPIATVAPFGPGQPYTPEMIAVALQDVPYTFPSVLQNDAVTAKLADALALGLWTYDGQPYREMKVAASCDDGAARCDLNVVGLPGFAPTRDWSDAYFWTVDPIAGKLELGSTGLKGYPPELGPELDSLARSLDTKAQFRNEPLRIVEWMIPPPAERFLLTYGDDQEGDVMTYVTLDRANRKILSIEARVCCG